METYQEHCTYLNNIKNALIYMVVIFDAIYMFAYPLGFWWPVIDKSESSRVYENLIAVMDIYLMPQLIFFAGFFLLCSLKTKTTLEYIKNMFFKLYVPLIVFVFCAGDIYFQMLFKRLDSPNPTYLQTFVDYWQDFSFNPISIMGQGKMLNQAYFIMSHTWFLSFLFFMTLFAILLSLLFRKEEKALKAIDSRNKIITKIIIRIDFL